MQSAPKELSRLARQGDVRAVSRLISLTEDKSPKIKHVIADLFKATGQAHVIGITGSPGAGKSTLVDQLAAEYKKKRQARCHFGRRSDQPI